MGKQAERNFGTLLGLLLGGGGGYMKYKRRQREEEKAEELRVEEAKATEAKLAREAEQEEYHRAQYQGQLQREMEDAGRKQVYAPPRERFQNPAAMTGREPPMQGFASFADQPGKWWEQLAPKPSAEEEAMASADILLKVIDKMNESAQPGMGWSGTSYQPLPGYGQQEGGDVLGLKPVDWDRFYDNATKMTYAKYGIADGMTPPNLDWDTINAEIMETAKTLAEPFLGIERPADEGLSAGAALAELAHGLLAGDPEAQADFADLQVNDPASAAIVQMILEQVQSAQGASAGGGGLGVGSIFDLINRGAETYQTLRGIPGEVGALPGRIQEGAARASGAAWPLRALAGLFR